MTGGARIKDPPWLVATLKKKKKKKGDRWVVVLTDSRTAAQNARLSLERELERKFAKEVLRHKS